MKNLIKLTVLIPFLLPFITMAQVSKNFIDQNYIEVQGRAEVDIVPDEIYIQIIINESDYKGPTELNELQNEMFKTLSGIGVDVEEDLTVKDMASNFEEYWLKKTDIQKSKSYELKVNTAVLAGNVFREMEKLGISNLNINRVDHSNIDEYRNQVKVNAVKNGKEKAGMLAKAIGQETGRALFIREMENYYRPVNAQVLMSARAGSAKEAAEPEIQFKKIHLEYSVQIYFELK
jgi:uncharacterized protein YggE